ncbi:interleukin-23 receptor [Perognathus longimembris pacificus]|uniref:interleukin-23 receptor n=1 Tax=Perognathus longimembris pacificus TaxID=214514 RepID=UPI00201994C4|nr:interleukin-23 receptor [Perognathus longimembris pacificus]
MNQIRIQLNVVIALYIFFSWCHGGIVNINCSGNLWVEPAALVRMGMNLSVYCQADIKNCQPKKLNFYKNGIKESTHITRINQTTAWLWYKNFLEPHASVYCTAECPGRFQETLICGKDISSGYPPDAPDQVTCVIHEFSGSMTCTWNPGTLTYIDTKYVVHVKSLETKEEHRYFTSSYVNISTDTLQDGREYLVWVQAENALGIVESKQLQIHLDDIVIPSASIISRAETINATVGKTIIYWSSETAIENISCEIRHRATTSQIWNVEEFDANFTYVQQSEFYLEPNVKYIFQVRCQETGKRYWQPWSSPFVHKTPETIFQVTPELFQHDTQNSGMPTASIFKEHLTSANSQDIGLLSGMVFFAILLSILSLIGVFNRSFRIRIKRKILLLIPKWLHEDIPNLENSNVVKMLQEKSECVNNYAMEQILHVDPVISEIREICLLDPKCTDDKKKKETEALEKRDCLQHLPLVPSPIVEYIPDPNTGYKPQASHLSPGGNHFSNHDIDSSGPKLPVDSVELEKNSRSKEYLPFAFPVSTVIPLSNTLILEELSLLSNQDATEEEDSRFLENDSPSETIPEQTLLPDEFVSCLGIMNEELPSISSYFPQNILERHFNMMSLLRK